MLQAAAQGVEAKILLSMMKGECSRRGRRPHRDLQGLRRKSDRNPRSGYTQNTLLSIDAKEYGIKFKKVFMEK